MKLNEKNNLNEDKNQINFNKFELFTEFTKNSYCSNNNNNTFLLFIVLITFFHLTYETDNISIISYNIFNLITQKIMAEIKNAHRNYINNFRYIFIKSSKKDIIISPSDIDNNLKLGSLIFWNEF